MTKLAGKVMGHSRISHGEDVVTSTPMGKRGELVVTRNTLYTLGTVDPEYEKAYPNAKERLLAALQEI